MKLVRHNRDARERGRHVIALPAPDAGPNFSLNCEVCGAQSALGQLSHWLQGQANRCFGPSSSSSAADGRKGD
eukprot:15446384-Alexandrium_andersonii.AAC.1